MSPVSCCATMSNFKNTILNLEQNTPFAFIFISLYFKNTILNLEHSKIRRRMDQQQLFQKYYIKLRAWSTQFNHHLFLHFKNTILNLEHSYQQKQPMREDISKILY